MASKSEILAALDDSRESFLETIESLSEEDLTEPALANDWSVKDILFHLSRWEGELVKLLWQARQGLKPSSIHFSSPDVDAMNARWAAESRLRPLEQALEDFHAVRNQTLRRVEAFSDHDLSDPNRFPWLGGRPLSEWIAGDSYEHEAEHAAQIQAWKKNR